MINWSQVITWVNLTVRQSRSAPIVFYIKWHRLANEGLVNHRYFKLRCLCNQPYKGHRTQTWFASTKRQCVSRYSMALPHIYTRDCSKSMISRPKFAMTEGNWNAELPQIWLSFVYLHWLINGNRCAWCSYLHVTCKAQDVKYVNIVSVQFRCLAEISTVAVLAVSE